MESLNADVDDSMEKNNSDDSDEEIFSKSKPKQNKRVKNLLDSDEEAETLDNNVSQKKESSQDSDGSDTPLENNLKTTKNKRRIVKQLDSDSDQSTSSPKKSEIESTKVNKSLLVDNHDSSSESEKETSNYSQSSRIKEKRHKFENKFKNMLTKRNKLTKGSEEKNNESKSNKETYVQVKSSLYDSESDDDDVVNDSKSEGRSDDSAGEERVLTTNVKESKSKGKQNKLQEEKPKVQRMSAKQAMEQMQKIKSESSRMLREKNVTLPYHKPKQMSLIDILAKRKNTTTKYGFKMDSDQLKEYAKELEKREKEMLELCKSESEEEEETEVNELNEEKKSEESEPKITEGEKKNVVEENEDFTSIQKACKNLLDLFDNEQNANTEVAVDEVNITETSNNCVVDNSKETEDTDAADKINNEVNLDKEHVDDICTLNTKNYETMDVVLNSDKDVALEENSQPVNKDEMEAHTEDNTENMDKDPAQNNCKILDTETKELPESELLFEDTDMDYDFKIDEIVAKANNDYDSERNYDKMGIDDDVHNISKTKEVSATQIKDRDRPLIASQQISCSAPAPCLQPKLTGTPGTFIDLISGQVQSGVELLKKKFMFHAAFKTAEELERLNERKILPGSALQKLKRDLEDKIIDNRTQEWTKRLEDLAKKKKEENDNLSDYEEILEKEESCKDSEKTSKDNGEIEEEESCEEEEELEENDVDLTKDKTRKKCGLLDEEAEVDDEENIVSADEKEESEAENQEMDCNDEGDNSEEDDSSDDSGDELTTNTGVKKTLTRIIKPFNDSDSSDDECNDKTSTLVQESNENVGTEEQPINGEVNLNVTAENIEDHSDLTTPIKENGVKPSSSSDVCESQSASKNNSFSYDWDDIPLGQKIVQSGTTPTPTPSVKRLSNISLTEDKPRNSGGGRSDLASLVSPIIKLSGVPRMSSSENDHSEELTSPNKYKFQYENEKMNILQKKLLFETEATQCSQDLEDLGSLCSGKFPSQETTSHLSSKPSNLNKLIGNVGVEFSQENGFTQDTENELLELCTGKFVGINNTQSDAMTTLPVEDSQNITLSLSETQNTEELNKAVENILSEKQISDTIEKKSVEDCDEVAATNPIEIVSNKEVKDSRINSFFKSNRTENLTSDVKSDVKNVSEMAVNNQGRKYAILSSDDDDDILDEKGEKDKSKMLKTKKERNKKLKKKIHLQFSDDESEEDNEVEDELSGEDVEENDHVVDYDSEENEIEVQTEKVNVNKDKKKKASEFFDNEAELTSEDEWIGSGDEDERGMDKLEWEEGDADQLDQREVKKQLERIHLRTILDDDKREVRMLQEILLEDDLEGGTRERKFRWRNVDSSIEVGATVGDDDMECGVEDMQTEEEWRKQRHERETFLRQMMEKENSLEMSQFSQDSEPNTLKIVSRTSITSSIVSRKSLTKDNIVTTCNGNTKTVESEEIMCNDKESLEKSRKVTKDLPSPVKKPFTLLKNNIRGSFLSRGPAALNRLAMLTKNAPQPQEEGEPTNLSSLAPGKKKNFVFATVSPPCNKNEFPEEVKMAKRKATSEISTPVLIKKTRLVEEATSKTRKSLIDHID